MELKTNAENYYIRNRETGKLELHFTKQSYAALTDAQKSSIKSNFLWGRNSGCWISRAKEPNLYYAERVANEIGLSDGGETGERLSFAEQMERKAERAERRAERADVRAERAEKRGDDLQKPIRDMHGDIAFFTQPNINTSAGRAFTNRRNKMFAAFERGFDEYRLSEHYRERAKAARATAAQTKPSDPAFCVRRIDDCKTVLRKLKRNMEELEQQLPALEATPRKRFDGSLYTAEDARHQLELWEDRMEAELDKLGYYQSCLDDLGGERFSRENVRPGYLVNVRRWGSVRVMRTGPKNFTGEILSIGCNALTMAYAEIISIEQAVQESPQQQPFAVGETFTLRGGEIHTIIKATAKTVTLQTPSGETYRKTPNRRAIPSMGKQQWCLYVGNSWFTECFYRD